MEKSVKAQGKPCTSTFPARPGVGYRWPCRRGQPLGLDGWCATAATAPRLSPRDRKRPWANSETWARQEPPGAVVSQVVCSPGDEEPARGFHQIPTKLFLKSG